MTQESVNCIVCASEFDPKELHSLASERINITNYKVCQSCIDKSDPAEDYREVRDIIISYTKISQAKSLYGEVKSILNSRKEDS